VGRLALVLGTGAAAFGRRGRRQGSWPSPSALGPVPGWPHGLAGDVFFVGGHQRGTAAVPDTCAGCWRWLGAGWRRDRRGLAVPTSPPASSPAEAPGPVLPGPRRLPTDDRHGDPTIPQVRMPCGVLRSGGRLETPALRMDTVRNGVQANDSQESPSEIDWPDTGRGKCIRRCPSGEPAQY